MVLIINNMVLCPEKFEWEQILHFPTSKETETHKKDTRTLWKALDASIMVIVVRDPQRFACVQAHHMMHLHYSQLFA